MASVSANTVNGYRAAGADEADSAGDRMYGNLIWLFFIFTFGLVLPILI